MANFRVHSKKREAKRADVSGRWGKFSWAGEKMRKEREGCRSQEKTTWLKNEGIVLST